MKHILLILTILVISTAAVSALEMVVTIPYTSDNDVAWLVDRGYSVDYMDRSIVRMVVSSQEYSELVMSGHRVTVDIANLAAHTRQVMGWDDTDPNSPPGYDTYDDVVQIMTDLANSYPNICKLIQVGTSVNGRAIHALKISKNVDAEEFEPELRFLGAHHGNEAISTVVCLWWTRDLLEQYGTDPEFTYIVDNYELWSQPIVNPDGYISSSRANAHGVDLNRNYSYMWQPGSGHGSAAFSEPETKAVRDYSIWDGPTDTNIFVASITGHSGAKCCNTVWNYSDAEHPSGSYHGTPDDEYIMYLGQKYTDLCPQPGFYLTNGCDWYHTFGDTNDWSYGEWGGFDYTLEYYGPGYNPAASGRETVYNYHKDATTAFFVDTDKYGIFGRVARTDAKGIAPLKAKLYVEGTNYAGWETFTDPTQWGDYYKLILPGTYTITCVPEEGGFDPITKYDVVVSAGQRTRVDFCFPFTTDVDLISFNASPTVRGIKLNWCVNGQTSETTYNLYRRVAGITGDKLAKFERLNSSPLSGGNTMSFVDSYVVSGSCYEYQLGVVDASGSESYHGPVTAVMDKSALAFRLHNNAPNPFVEQTRLRIDMSSVSPVTLHVYDVSGRLIRILKDSELAAGSHSIVWDGKDTSGRHCPAGVYSAVLTAGNESASLRMVKANR